MSSMEVLRTEEIGLVKVTELLDKEDNLTVYSISVDNDEIGLTKSEITDLYNILKLMCL